MNIEKVNSCSQCMHVLYSAGCAVVHKYPQKIEKVEIFYCKNCGWRGTL